MCHVIICSAHQQLSLAEMDVEHPGSYDISSFGDRTKKNLLITPRKMGVEIHNFAWR